MNDHPNDTSGLRFACDPATGLITSLRLYGTELLDTAAPSACELSVNGLPLKTRLYPSNNNPLHDNTRPLEEYARLKGERFVSHLAGAGLVVVRQIGERPGLKHRCVGVRYHIRREPADLTDLLHPGPGGPVVEAPLYVDAFTLPTWNWKFWGDDTRMVFASTHSNGPSEEWGHIGYENDTPEEVKRYLQNVIRRTYPGTMTIHGGLYFNAVSGHWLAITCRQPTVGYVLNIENAGRGVAYDFTLHAPFPLGESLPLPEMKLYFGETPETMWSWLADYVTHYLEEPPTWVFQTLFGQGVAWDNQPTWTEQADYWERKLDAGECSGISYSLVTSRPIRSGTTPTGYAPDPNHGTQDEFRRMCRRLADRGGPDIDDDWFIRGIDGRICAAWGDADVPDIAHINPGHPGYIEYTKRWIRFYIRECGAKGIFMDCLGWAFPPDFTPRPWMRYPGDTNRMGVRFLNEVYACIKECDPEAILLGEGTTIEGPVHIFSLSGNPVRPANEAGMGPRDFFLWLNRYASKRICIDQGPSLFPGSGFCTAEIGEEGHARNRYLTQLLKERGARDTFTPLSNDLSIHGNRLIVPARAAADIRLPEHLAFVQTLTDEITGAMLSATSPGFFPAVPTGIYRMEK